MSEKISLDSSEFYYKIYLWIINEPINTKFFNIQRGKSVGNFKK